MQQDIDNRSSIPEMKVLRGAHALAHRIVYESKYEQAKMHQKHPLQVNGILVERIYL